MENQSWIVDHASNGTYDSSCLRLVDGPIPAAPDGKMLVRTSMMSIDPTNLNWLKLDPRLQAVPIRVGGPMIGVSIGTVIESRVPGYRPGDVVTGLWGWRRFEIADPALVRPARGGDIPFEQQLAIFSHVGRAAAGGLTLIGSLKASDAVLVSGAAGATGSLAVQIARARGCRTVGIAGGSAKCEYLRGELGLDAVIDYKRENLTEVIPRHFPNGVDLFFDNVGGELLDVVLQNMAIGCRIVVCGAMSQYDISDRSNLYGVKNLPLLIFRRARMEGFVAEFGERNREIDHLLEELFYSGSLKARSHVVEGFENVPQALPMLLDGRNQGKLVARV